MPTHINDRLVSWASEIDDDEDGSLQVDPPGGPGGHPIVLAVVDEGEDGRDDGGDDRRRGHRDPRTAGQPASTLCPDQSLELEAVLIGCGRGIRDGSQCLADPGGHRVSSARSSAGELSLTGPVVSQAPMAAV